MTTRRAPPTPADQARRRRGRAPIAEAARKSEIVHGRVTVAVYDAICQRALREGKAVSSVIAEALAAYFL